MASILLIEDDPFMVDVFHRALRTQRHEIYSVETAADGLEFFANCHFDLVICDMFLPDRDGFDVLKSVRGMAPDQKILIATGGGKFGMLGVLEVAEQTGATATYCKTDGLDLFLHTVARLVGSPNTPATLHAA